MRVASTDATSKQSLAATVEPQHGAICMKSSRVPCSDVGCLYQCSPRASGVHPLHTGAPIPWSRRSGRRREATFSASTAWIAAVYVGTLTPRLATAYLPNLGIGTNNPSEARHTGLSQQSIVASRAAPPSFNPEYVSRLAVRLCAWARGNPGQPNQAPSLSSAHRPHRRHPHSSPSSMHVAPLSRSPLPFAFFASGFSLRLACRTTRVTQGTTGPDWRKKYNSAH